MPDQRWLTVEMAAEYAPCRVRTIRTLIWTGELPRVKFGRRFLIDRNDLDKLLESRKQREIDPAKPLRLSGRKRAESLKVLYPHTGQADTDDKERQGDGS
jgi:excisionase family DNA binding protein